MGMAHRGRLNVLANIVGKSYAQIFREFEGELDPNVPAGLGRREVPRRRDRQVHQPRRARRSASRSPPTRATSKRSTRSSRAWRAPSRTAAATPTHEHVLPVLIHGDAAFAGQGVVAETLNLSELPGYDVGGTVHIVVNNQVGFTTTPGFARSTVYATDIAKAVQAPIFHVNGDDPEATRARRSGSRSSSASAFKKDVVVDMVCYRRYGHNEGDEPAFTQPRMYEVIGKRRSVRKLYTELLVNRGDLTLEEAEQALEDFRARLEAAFEETHARARAAAAAVRSHRVAPDDRDADALDTGVPRERARRGSSTRSTTFPDGFELHPKLAAHPRQPAQGVRRRPRSTGRWPRRSRSARCCSRARRCASPARTRGAARSASATRCSSTTAPKPSTRRSRTSATTPAPFMIYDSVLSEFAALGFEYGYSVADRDALVCWEAQFGDFANGAQTIIDQFIVAAEDKWGQRSGLVLLLPHGFEGQGPEHSSARLERFLVLCARGQHPRRLPDHRRAVLPRAAPPGARPDRKPLIVMTPKRYLRMPATVLAGRRVRRRAASSSCSPIPRARPADGRRGSCSARGKFGHELIARRDEMQARRSRSCGSSSSTRGPSARSRPSSTRYAEAEVVWAQEEPGNMGARYFARRRIEELAGGRAGRRRRPPREPEPRDRQLHRARRAAAGPPGRGRPHAITPNRRDGGTNTRA